MANGYPSDWDSRRKKVYQRDEYTCQNCGIQGGPRGDAELHAHHIVPKSKGGTHNTSNLKTLCRDCHNAIHGNSVAPTAESPTPNSNQSTAQLQFPLYTGRFLYSLAEEIDCGNQIADTYESVNAVLDTIEQLNDLAQTMQSVPGSERPARLSERVHEVAKTLDEQLQTLHSDLDSFEDTVPWNATVTTLSKYADFYQTVVDLQTVISEYRTVLENLSTDDAEGDFRGTLIELKLLADDLDAALESYSDASEELVDRLYEKIADELHRVDSQTSSITPITPESCPVCAGDTTVVRRSIDEIDLSYSLLRCTECDTEWLIDLNTLTVSSGPTELEGVSMAPTVWKRGADLGYSLPEDLTEFSRLSETYEREKKRLIAAVAAGEIGILIASYMLGNVLLWLVGTILLVAVARGLFSFRLDQVLGGSSSLLSGLFK
jgi:hypothetical protein